MIRAMLLVTVSLIALPLPAAGQEFACGGHVIIGSDAPRALDAPPGSHLRPRIDQPSWMTARDSELWDALVYKESDLSNLAYEVGPNVDYPGLVGATPVPALPFIDSLFRWIIR